MKQVKKTGLVLLTFAFLASSISPALARHWGNGGLWHSVMNTNSYTAEQQAAVQEISNDYYGKTSTLHQQLIAKQYEYNALLMESTPNKEKINIVAKEIETMNLSLDALRVKRDTALAQAGLTQKSAELGYYGHRRNENHRDGDHFRMRNW